MGVPYVTFMKHAEKITKSVPASRPILKGVHHGEDGSLAVTDSHRLYFAKESQERKDGASINPKTGEVIDGNYPDVSRLIPDSNYHFTVDIPVIEAVKALKALSSCGKTIDKTPRVVLKKSEYGWVVALGNRIMSAQYKLFGGDVTKSDSETEIMFDLQYLLDAMEMFKDVGLTEVTLYSFGRLRPFIVKANDDLIALLLPVRTTN